MNKTRFECESNSLPVFWLVGLSGSGKTTLANILARELKELDYPVCHIDGDEFRKQFNFSGFSREDRFKNINAMREYVLSLQAAKQICVVSAITPYSAMRTKNALEIPNYHEIWIKCPMRELIRRDTKGLYALAKLGRLDRLTGVGDNFDQPLAPVLAIDTSIESPEASGKRLSIYATAILGQKKIGALPPPARFGGLFAAYWSAA